MAGMPGICPMKRVAMSCADTHAINTHIEGIARTTGLAPPPPSCPTGRDDMPFLPPNSPRNITVLRLLPRSPELNSTGNIPQFMRDNRLSNHVFPNHDDILVHCCRAQTGFASRPKRTASVGAQE